MDGWTILLTAIAAVALLLTAVGWLLDRRATLRRRRAMTAPPERVIPNFRPEAVAPRYLTELEARETGLPVDALALDATERTRVRTALQHAPTVPTGWLVEELVTDPAEGWAVAPHPAVLVCAEPVRQVRELYAVLELVAPAGRPLVVVAPELDAEVVNTLLVNHLQENLRVVVVAAAATDLDRVAELTAATPVSRVDLMSGYPASEALGVCGWWVSSRTQSWVIEGGADDIAADAGEAGSAQA